LGAISGGAGHLRRSRPSRRLLRSWGSV
jgi:hypothetical protein